MEHSRETAKRVIAQRLAAVVEDAARLGLRVKVEPVDATAEVSNPPAVITVQEARPQ